MFNNLPLADDVYFSSETKTILRAEKEYLVKMADTQTILIPAEVQAFKCDFCRIMRLLQIPIELYWVTMFINDIQDPNQDISGMTSFLVVNKTVIDAILRRTNTTNG